MFMNLDEKYSSRWIAACSAAEDAAKHDMSGESMATLRELVLLLQNFVCPLNWMKTEVYHMAEMNEPARDLPETCLKSPRQTRWIARRRKISGGKRTPARMKCS